MTSIVYKEANAHNKSEVQAVIVSLLKVNKNPQAVTWGVYKDTLMILGWRVKVKCKLQKHQ